MEPPNGSGERPRLDGLLTLARSIRGGSAACVGAAFVEAVTRFRGRAPATDDGELQKIGFLVSERTIGRYLRRLRRRGDAGKRWLGFLQNHREAIVTLDFFTVPTIAFKLLYGFFTQL
jgi:hypothetical protein